MPLVSLRVGPLCALMVVGCTSADLQLAVDIKTDLAPNEEFVRVRTQIFDHTPGADSTPIGSAELATAGIDPERFVPGVPYASDGRG